jgi:hypothetical protein
VGGEVLISLASAGAAALVGAAATEAWGRARVGFGRLFGHGDTRREERTVARLDETATAIEQADDADQEGVRRALLLTWQIRLTDLLEEFPELAEDLRALTESVRAVGPTGQQQRAQATETGSVSTASNGGITIANTGVMGDVQLPGGWR